MTKTRPFLSMCYGDPSATEVPPCCETATKNFTFSTTSVLLLLNMPLSLSRATIFRRQKNPRRVYRPKIAGILFVCNEPEGKYYTVPRPLLGEFRVGGGVHGSYTFQCGLVERGSSVGRTPVSQSREPGFESPVLPFRSLGIFFHFTTPQSTQLYK